jgi:hypothetical protein
LLRGIIDRVDKRLIEIRVTSKNLFQADLDKEVRGVDLPSCDAVCADRICWDVEEPEFGPWEASNYAASRAPSQMIAMMTGTLVWMRKIETVRTVREALNMQVVQAAATRKIAKESL